MGFVVVHHGEMSSARSRREVEDCLLGLLWITSLRFAEAQMERAAIRRYFIGASLRLHVRFQTGAGSFADGREIVHLGSSTPFEIIRIPKELLRSPGGLRDRPSHWRMNSNV